MLGGYAGKMLFVNLSSKTIEVKDISDELVGNFIGGYGLGAKILYDMMKPGTDPLGPDNILGFITGPATGTGPLFGSRYMLVCKSPVTGGWNDANSGGFFGKELKNAGFDAVFVSGASKTPVYLWIKDGKAEIRDANHLWGKNANETHDLLIEETGDKKIRSSIIGSAGEKLSLISCPINDGHRAAARGGGGAVMGSKKLKAVVVRGNLDITVANPEKLKEISQRALNFMKNEKKEGVAALGGFGTSVGTGRSALDGNSPVMNWKGIGIKDYGTKQAVRLDSSELDKFKEKKYACSNCPLGCGAEYNVKSGKWPVGRTDRPEYESASAFGSLLLNGDPEAMLKCNDICNLEGLDTISAGATIAWAIECYENGLFTKDDTGGIELKWGNAQEIVKAMELMADQSTEFGKLLALGSEAASRKTGKGAEFLVTVKGIELPMHDPKYAPGFGRTYQFDPTPGRHVKGGLGHMQEVGDIKEKYNFDGTGYIDVFDTFNKEVMNSAGFCLFSEGFMPEGTFNEYIEALTGMKFGYQQIFRTGRRILSMRQAFNLREGLTNKDFVIPKRVTGEDTPQSEGPLKGIKIDTNKLGRSYYASLDWNFETGKPSLESLKGAGGLDNVIRDLYGAEALK
jgi:aldehyde:ferredoxin oxidoreductase